MFSLNRTWWWWQHRTPQHLVTARISMALKDRHLRIGCFAWGWLSAVLNCRLKRQSVAAHVTQGRLDVKYEYFDGAQRRLRAHP